jgi:aminoglycoside phosphotransferase (APT) family kinase protein
MSDVIVAPNIRDLDVLAARMGDWLAGKLRALGADVRDMRLSGLDYPRGAGQSHETILFEADWDEAGVTRNLSGVVRIKPQDFTVFPDDLFDAQYQVMQTLHRGAYVKVAEPLWIEQDASLLGAPFFVMRKVVGRVPVSLPPYAQYGWVAQATPDQRRKMWESGVAQLAAVQKVPLEAVAFLAGKGDARDGLAQEFDKYRRFVTWLQDDVRTGDAPAILAAGLARLGKSWPKNQPTGMVWGDARLGNMMFDADFQVAAVMDWEQPSLGGALQDLAWWLVISETMHGANAQRPHLAGMGTRAETIALWQQLTGKSADDIEWYEQFTQLKMSCTGVRLGALRGKPMFDDARLKARLQV